MGDPVLNNRVGGRKSVTQFMVSVVHWAKHQSIAMTPFGKNRVLEIEINQHLFQIKSELQQLITIPDYEIKSGMNSHRLIVSSNSETAITGPSPVKKINTIRGSFSG